MSEPLPERIDPLRDLQRGGRVGRRFQGHIPLTRMERLLPSLLDGEGEAEVELALGRDAEGVAFLQGTVRARLRMTCQRCLEAVELPLEAPFRLGLVESEGLAERLPERYDPIVTHSEPVAILPLVEDELILALPVIPRHEACSAFAGAEQESAASGEAERGNPFAVLATLKRKH